MGARMPPLTDVVRVGGVGFMGYGLSLVLFVYALRELGTSRTAAYFSFAPFVGALVAVVSLGESLNVTLLLAGALMGWGVWLHVTERHLHDHAHEATEHEHAHEHDEHHDHHQDESVPPGSHTHAHTHTPLRHRHPRPRMLIIATTTSTVRLVNDGRYRKRIPRQCWKKGRRDPPRSPTGFAGSTRTAGGR